MRSQWEYVAEGMAVDPSDSPYRLAEEYRRQRARAATEESGCEVLTIDGASLVFDKGQSTVRRAAAKGQVPVLFEISSSLGGPKARLLLLRDCESYWGPADRGKLNALRDRADHISIDGLLWAVIGPAPRFEVNRVD